MIYNDKTQGEEIRKALGLQQGLSYLRGHFVDMANGHDSRGKIAGLTANH
jgi:hypothetical protein